MNDLAIRTFDRPAATSVISTGRWFSVLWPAAILFHLAANSAQMMALRPVGLTQLVMAVVALAVMARPSSARAMVLSGLYLAILWAKLPAVGNHEVILGLMAAVVLLAAASTARSDGLGSVAWVGAAKPACRWILVISYGFIGFSKLNSGFFDTKHSCAAVFLDESSGLLGFSADRFDRFNMAVIIMIATIELAIPVLLLTRRLRTRGAVLGLGFHFLLALEPVSHVWDFSATLLPLFLLFMPEPFTASLELRLLAVAQRIRSAGARAPQLAVALLFAAQAAVLASPAPNWLLAYPLWLALAGPILVAAFRSVFTSGPQDPRGVVEQNEVWRVGFLFVPVIAVAVAIGVGPYLEVRSSAAFNMYSNLQIVDGRSNHFLIGSPRPDTGPPGSNTASSVSVVTSAAEGSPLSYYVGSGLLVPNENLSRHLKGNAADGAAGEGVRASVADYFGNKLAFRRAVDGTDVVRCQRAWGPLG
ncbi:MAG: hypothetical protein ACRBK7_06430 [Acidimicrobiales bacterium]